MPRSPRWPRRARTVTTQPGEVLFAEGDRDCDFFVVLAGRVGFGRGARNAAERVIAVHGRGRFLGELSLLTGEGSYYSAVAVGAGELLAVPVARLRELVARDPAFGNLVLRAYLLRRSILIGLGAGLRIFGSRYSRTPGGSRTSRPGTGCRAGGWTSRMIRPPTAPTTTPVSASRWTPGGSPTRCGRNWTPSWRH